MTPDEIVKRIAQLAANRSVWEEHWTEIADRVLPRAAGSFLAFGLGATPGEKRTEKVYDSSATLALDRFAAAMESMLTPRNSKWHRLRASDNKLNRNRDVLVWFDEVTDILFRRRYSPRANFASQQHENYIGLGAFGTAAMYIEEDPDEPGLRYRSVHLSEIFFCEDFSGIVNQAFRKYKRTAQQIAERYGKTAVLPDKVLQAAKDKPDTEFFLIHYVGPNRERRPGRLDAAGMAFESVTVLEDGKVELNRGGYRSFPYAISRYVTAPGEVYGRSPAMTALPAIKVLNEEKKTFLKQGHRTADPVLLAHDDGVLDTFSLKPGAVNVGGVSSEGRPLIHALPTGSLAMTEKMMEMERAVINDVFLVTLFQILVESPQMTATEVLERVREKGALLSPTMGRQQSEALGPMIEREIDLLSMQGLLPPMPGILREAQGDYRVEYDSPLSRAQKAEEASGFMRTMEFALTHANATQSPDALDWLDVDAAIPEIAEIQAVPARWIASAEKVAAIREGRAQARQTQTMVDAAPAGAALMKTMMGAGK
jgi:hypothetical protein